MGTQLVTLPLFSLSGKLKTHCTRARYSKLLGEYGTSSASSNFVSNEVFASDHQVAFGSAFPAGGTFESKLWHKSTYASAFLKASCLKSFKHKLTLSSSITRNVVRRQDCWYL
jgi:hypothetical protein